MANAAVRVDEQRLIAEDIHRDVRQQHAHLLESPHAYFSSMVVGKLLLALKQLRTSLEVLQVLPMRNQEELAWLTLNGCKLIYDIAQPLIWNSCGNYVIETLGFAALSMENVINLCTVRHMSFRMKLYVSIFYCGLSLNNLDQAQGAWDHALKEFKELREREELDPPLPDKTVRCIEESVEDLFVLRFVLDVWRDIDSMSLLDPFLVKYKDWVLQYGGKYYAADASVLLRRLRNKMIVELTRTHLLASGNANETYQKRSARMGKAFEAVLVEKKAVVHEEFALNTLFEMANALVVDLDQEMSPESFSIFESIIQSLKTTPTRSIDTDAMEMQESGDTDNNMNSDEVKRPLECSKEFHEKLSILHLLQKFSTAFREHSEGQTSAETISVSPKKVVDIVTPDLLQDLHVFFEEMNELLYLESSFRSRSLYTKVILAIFDRLLYRPLQLRLSQKKDATSDENAMAFFKSIVYPLQVVVKTLDLCFAEDAIMTSGLALLCGHVLAHIGEQREAISLLKHSLHAIEDQRAARVDFWAHCPEDVRDVLALQRQSFTVRSDGRDWFHSVKRLGAHAFAGFGIFGLGSSADRSDQALAELHTDILTLYFRVELQYSVVETRRHSAHRASLAAAKAAEDAAKLDPSASSKKKTAASKSKTTSNKLTTTAKPTESMTVVQQNADWTSLSYANVEKLPAVQSLKAYCAKNKYALAVLFLEIAKIEKDLEKRIKLMEQSRQAIEDVEAQEARLISGFEDLVVMTDAVRRYPIVLSRSHRYIYLAPVACRKLKKANQYRILAKPKGSGTEVSLYNNDLPGCDVAIGVEKLVDLKQSVVRIGPLRNGEIYVFGCAGFAPVEKDVALSTNSIGAAEQAVGGASPTSPDVEAVNPLPTVMLWALLAEACFALNLKDISLDASSRVCSRLLLKQPIRPVVSLTNGQNLFLNEEHTMCALSLQQTTLQGLHHFLNCFVVYETQHFERELFGHASRWNDRNRQQLRYLDALRRCALVVSLSSSLQLHDITCRVLSIASQQLEELMQFDQLALANFLQNPVLALVVSLQRIPKTNWHAFEHRLYYQLCGWALQLAVLTHDVKPVLSLLNDFYCESRESPVSELALPPKEVNDSIDSLLAVAQQWMVPSLTNTLVEDFKKLLLPPAREGDSPRPANSGDVVSFWKLSLPQRRLMTADIGKDFLSGPTGANPDRQKLEMNLLFELPMHYSHYMSIQVTLMQQCFQRGQVESIDKFFDKMPICLSYCAPDVQSELNQWLPSLVLSLDTYISNRTLANEALSGQSAATSAAGAKGKAPPPKKGAPAAAAAPADNEPPPLSERLRSIPERYTSNVAVEESQLQFVLLADMMSLAVAAASGQGRERVNHFVSSKQGPRRAISGMFADSLRAEVKALLSPVEHGSEEGKTSEAPKLLVANRASAMAWMLMAIIFYSKGGRSDSAVNAAVQFWNFITCEYLDPLQAIQELVSHGNAQQLLFSAFAALTSVLNSIAVHSQHLDEVNPILLALKGHLEPQSSTEESEPVVDNDSQYALRECQEKFSVVFDCFVFLSKCVWLVGENLDQFVLRGCQSFALYALNAEVSITVNLSDTVMPLVVHSQQELVVNAERLLEESRESLERFVRNYEEEQQRQRKKKLRIARLEKTDEELAFEARKAELETIVAEKSTMVQKRKSELGYVQSQCDAFTPNVDKGLQLLKKAKAASTALFLRLETEFGSQADLSTLLRPDGLLLSTVASMSSTSSVVSASTSSSSTSAFLQKVHVIYDSIDSVYSQYKKAIKYLRDNKQRVALTEALIDMADVFLRFALFDDARQLLFDVVDGLFNTMDACLHWPEVLQSCGKDQFDFSFVPGVINVLIALGKLSKFYSNEDSNAKSQYARFAGEVSMLLFGDSIHLPRHLSGFAAYELTDFGGWQSIPIDRLKELYQAILENLVPVLQLEEQELVSLPLLALGEYIAAYVLRNSRKWLDMRICRVRSCVQLRMFAEAISMLSGIKVRIPAIADHSWANPFAVNSNLATENLSTFQLSKNGLAFHDAPMFVNNCWPSPEPEVKSGSWQSTSLHEDHKRGAESNAKALEWVNGLPTVLESFLGNFVVAVPESELSPADRERIEAERQKARDEAAAAAAEAAKKSKGKAAPPVVEPPEPSLPTVKLFPTTQVVDLFIVCASLLADVGMLDGSTCNTNCISDFRTKQLVNAKSLLRKARLKLWDDYSTDDVEEDYALRILISEEERARDVSRDKQIPLLFRRADWFVSFARVSIVESQIMMFLRQWRQSQLAVHSFMKLLRHPHFGQASLQGELKFYLGHYWLESRRLLIQIAIRQSKFVHGRDLLSVAIVESQAMAHLYFLRKFLIASSRIALAQKEIARSQSDCNKAIELSEDIHLRDSDLVELMILRVDLQREDLKNFNPSVTHVNLLRDERGGAYHLYNSFVQMLVQLREAYDLAKTLMQRHGGYPVDFNVTYARAENSVRGHHLLPPLLHSLTDLHNNEPPVTISAEEVNSIEASLHRGEWVPTYSQRPLKQEIRLGPVDASDSILSPSEFVNVYLRSSRVLLSCQLASLVLLDDIRSMRVGRWMRLLVQQIQEDMKNAMITKKKPLIDFDEENMELLDEKVLLQQQYAMAEESLKLMRHVIFVSPAVRSKIYLYASKARIAKSAPAEPGRELEHQQQIIGPLLIGLQYVLRLQASYLWPTIKAMCLQLVEVFGDDSIDLHDDSSQRMKQALQYLLMAIVSNNQQRKITEASLELSSDASFSTIALPEELQRILHNSIQTSMSNALPNTHPAVVKAAQTQAAATEQAKDAKGKPAKGTAAPATNATTATMKSFSGRDAIHLLSSLQREVSSLQCDGFSNDLALDVHLLLKKTFPVYETQCCLSSLPLETDPLVVPCNSVSTSWLPVATPEDWYEVKQKMLPMEDFLAIRREDSNKQSRRANSGVSSEQSKGCAVTKASMDSFFGFYSHSSVFFILGDAKAAPAAAAAAAPPAKGGKEKADPNAAAAAANSVDPVLTKVVLYRGDVFRIAANLRRLREVFTAPKSASPEDIIRSAREFAQWTHAIVLLLRHGYVPKDAFSTDLWTDESITVADNVVKVVADKIQFSLPFNAKVLTSLANLFTTERDMLNVVDSEICTFIRYSLGHKSV